MRKKITARPNLIEVRREPRGNVWWVVLNDFARGRQGIHQYPTEDKALLAAVDWAEVMHVQISKDVARRIVRRAKQPHWARGGK
jgi:hypothetical protein